MKINRRDFLKISALMMGGIPLRSQLDKLSGFGFNFEDIQVLEQEEWGIVRSKGMPIIRIPLLDDGFWDESTPIKTFTLKEGVELGYSKRRLVKLDDEVFHAVLIPSSIGGRHMHIGIIGIERQGEHQEFAETDNGKDGRNIFSIIGEYYPNKLFNIMEGANRVINRQREIGFLSGGEEYSLLELIGARNGDQGFITGFTTFHVEVNAGGVCAFATTFSNSVAKNSTIKKLWEHPAKYKYFVAPADPDRSESTTDASLSWGAAGWFDFLFVPDENMRLVVTCDLVQNGAEDIGDLGPGADMLLVLSLRWTSEIERSDIVDGLDNLATIREGYTKFRDGEAVPEFSEVMQSVEWGSDNESQKIIEDVYPDEVVDHFIPELHNDEWIKLVSEIVEQINDYAETYEGYQHSDVSSGLIPGLGDHLYEKIFSGEIYHNDDGSIIYLLRDSLWHLDHVSLLDGKPTWEIGFSALLGSLRSVFGNVVPRRLLGYGFNYASEIVPEEYWDFEDQFLYRTEFGYYLASPKSEHDVKVGNMLVRYETPVGHCAVVIGKKKIGTKTVLLLADANRKDRGMARLFQVDEINFKHVFGQFPVKPVVVI
jgi:hypothetical protein